MAFSLPKIYPITDAKLSGLSHADQVRQFVEAGAKLIQIREKKASSRDFFEAVTESLGIGRSFGAKVIVNDRLDIALAAGADGVHLGQDDLSPEDSRKLLGDHAIIGYSTHSVKQAIEAASMPVDYIAIGPVFGTMTKQKPDPVVGLDGLRAVRKAISSTPLVAIGGISESNLADVFAAGADSAAIISALYTSDPDIKTRFAQLYERTNNVQRT